MKTPKLITLFLFTFLSVTLLFGQSNHTEKMAHKIDSIANAKNMHYGIVKVKVVSTVSGKTYTQVRDLTKVKKFYFDGPFLVLENMYINIEKLSYFVIRNKHFEFYIQDY